MASETNIDALLSISEVQKLTSLSRASIYRFIAEQRFPRPVKLSPRGRVAWRAWQVKIWSDDPLDWDEEFFNGQDSINADR